MPSLESNPRAPLLSESHRIENGMFPKFRGPGIFSGPTLSESTILELLNCPDETERDRLTVQWRDHKLKELNFVGIVAALLTGCLTSTGSWPTILPGQAQPWQIRTCWYVGTMFGLASIFSAADQTIWLHRIAAHNAGLPHLRLLLKGDARRKDGFVIPKRRRMFTWQLPVMFLTCCAVTMIIGIWVLVWTAAANTISGSGWGGNANSAVTFSTITALIFTVFFMGQRTLRIPIQELNEDVDE